METLRIYEGMVIVNSALEGAGQETCLEDVRNLLKKDGGKILSEKDLGKKKLAYKIDEKRNGNYSLFYFKMDPTKLEKLKRTLKIDDRILRFLILLDEDYEQRGAQEQIVKQEETVEKGESGKGE